MSRWATTNVVFVFLAAAAYLYTNLFLFPNTPILLTGDQTYFWMNAQRMMFGELPYRDFFQFTPPGTNLIYLSVFHLFGTRIWVTNAVVLVLGMVLCWVCYSVSRRILGRDAACLATLLFLTLVYGKLLNATHHWFSMLCILCALWVGMEKWTLSRIAAAGALLGAAAFFTHTHAMAALVSFAAMLGWLCSEERRPLRVLAEQLLILVSAFVVVWIVCDLPFLFAVGFRQLWYYEVLFVLRYMVHSPEGGFLGEPGELRFARGLQVLPYLTVYALMAIAYPLSIWKCWTRRCDQDRRLWNSVALLAVTGSVLAIEVAFSLNWLRLFIVSVPAVVLAVFWLDRTPVYAKQVCATRVVWAAVVVFALAQTWSRHHHKYVVADLPAGRAALTPRTYEKLDWLRQNTQPGEFFFEALVPSAYLPLGLRNPLFAEGMTRLPQTRPEFVERSIRELDAEPTRYILWSHNLNASQGAGNQTDVVEPFFVYLRDHYQLRCTFSDGDEVWERK